MSERLELVKIPAVTKKLKETCTGCMLIHIEECGLILKTFGFSSCNSDAASPNGYIFINKQELNEMTKKDEELTNEAVKMFPVIPLADALFKYAKHLEEMLGKIQDRQSEAYGKLAKKFLTVKILARKAEAAAKKQKQAV